MEQKSRLSIKKKKIRYVTDLSSRQKRSSLIPPSAQFSFLRLSWKLKITVVSIMRDYVAAGAATNIKIANPTGDEKPGRDEPRAITMKILLAPSWDRH